MNFFGRKKSKAYPAKKAEIIEIIEIAVLQFFTKTDPLHHQISTPAISNPNRTIEQPLTCKDGACSVSTKKIPTFTIINAKSSDFFRNECYNYNRGATLGFRTLWVLHNLRRKIDLKISGKWWKKARKWANKREHIYIQPFVIRHITKI